MTNSSGSGRIQFEHKRVGAIELAEEELLLFDGLPGFPEARRFALLRHSEDSCFAWLACVDDPTLAFAVVDPLDLFPDYAPCIEPEDLALVGAKGTEDVCLLAIANLSGSLASANLAAPLLVHAATRRGAQLVLSDEQWPLRAEIPRAARPQRSRGMPARPALSALSRAQTESNPQT